MEALSLERTDQSRGTPAAQADVFRTEVSWRLDPKKRSALGQYLTPLSVAAFMASLFEDPGEEIALLDPGAGTGVLAASFVEEMSKRDSRPLSMRIDAFEVERILADYLACTLKECRFAGESNGVQVSCDVMQTDFIKWGVDRVFAENGLLGKERPQFTHCIMNPPYKKIRSDSEHRRLLREVGIETGNLYSAFLALAIKLLRPGGELVAIVPRSFCNGPYFKPFRKLLLDEMAIDRLHIFDARDRAFKDDEVLQENIILHAVKGRHQGTVEITSSTGPEFEDMTCRTVEFEKIVKPLDLDRVIHMPTSGLDQLVIDRISVFSNTLAETGVEICTGPVVDFRLRQDIRQQAGNGAKALIYPGHFSENFVQWPKPDGKKPNAIQESERSSRWLMKNGWYVVTKRFSAKEEKRRIVAALHSPERVPGDSVGFENHLNVFHQRKAGLDPAIAKGLAVYLNSTLLDLYFRQFSGHTQVNAADLRGMHYPDRETLIRLGEQIEETFPSQAEVDRLLDLEIDRVSDKDNGNPLMIQRRTNEALSILKALGLPKAQQNDRSALTLLALANLKPKDKWSKASNPLIGITPIMDFIRDHYAKEYAPNTRETIRRQTIHQFVEAGIAVPNPDKPLRSVNSPKTVYQISENTLELIRSFGKRAWKAKLAAHLTISPALAAQYAKERTMTMIPLRINGDKELSLTPGEHSQLIRDIVEEFGPRFAPGAEVLYVGDTGSKMGHFDEAAFQRLGLTFDSHGKFPDVVLYFVSKNWLLLIEAVTSHGPVNAKRHAELETLFEESSAGIVYVTAFPDRRSMGKYLGDIAWETEVWTADAPSHLIHFNGERFLGPYDAGE